MQGFLLALCFVWKARQRRLGVDDFGKPLPGHEPSSAPAPAPAPRPQLPPTASANTEAGAEGQLYRQPTLGPAIVEQGRGEDERTPLLSGARNGVSSKGLVDRLPWFRKK